jgi:hypothetical protein
MLAGLDASAAGLDEAGRDSLVFQFDLVTVQRKLKDAGRFVFIDKKKNKEYRRTYRPTSTASFNSP